MTNATDELLRLLDDFEHECFMLRVEASETRAKNEAVRDAYERIREESAQAIAATLCGECEFTIEYDRDEVERRRKMYEENPFGLFPQDMPQDAWTCSNCGKQFKCHYNRETGTLLPVPDWMKHCPNCGFKIRKAAKR